MSWIIKLVILNFMVLGFSVWAAYALGNAAAQEANKECKALYGSSAQAGYKRTLCALPNNVNKPNWSQP